jgi:hypothetical protein
MPEGAIVAEGEDFDSSACEVECCLEPSKSKFRLWLRVPALMSPHRAVRRLLPSITERSVARCEDLKVAVWISLH